MVANESVTKRLCGWLTLILTYNSDIILEKMFSIDSRYDHNGGTSVSIKVLEGSFLFFSLLSILYHLQ